MKLKKHINFFGIFSIATGAMVSSGIFILPGLAYARTGPSVFISYLLAGVLALVGIFSVIELSTAMPKAGGDYFFINRSLGPLLGTISGFLGWLALSLKSAFAIFGISEIVFLFMGINPLISGFVLCCIFVALNIIGVKEAVFFQIILVASLLGLMLFYILVGIPKMNLQLFQPFLKNGIDSVIATSGFIFVSFGGLLKVASIAEEVKKPKRNIPLGLLSSVVVVTIIYTALIVVTTGVLSPEDFVGSLTPVADCAKIIMGNAGYAIIMLASLLAFITTANAGIMAASRYPLALSRDKLLPSAINKVNKKFQTPSISILMTGVFIFVSLLLPLNVLVKAASTVILTAYILTNISVIVLRESRLANYRPSFKAPFYPWLQICTIFIFSFFIVDLGKEALEISLGFLFVSICVYFFYGKNQEKKEYALLHILKRIVNNRLTDNLLETELRGILKTRDNLEFDRFDNLIKEAQVIDLEGPLGIDELFDSVSADIAEKINIEKDIVLERLHERQKQANTAISTFVAIPHILFEGEGKMFMMLVRCKRGVRFTEKQKAVKAVFVFGGTVEERELHLRTLAAISALVQQPDFKKKWMAAENSYYLKNMVLLSKRIRVA